jgi:hypothetical protein
MKGTPKVKKPRITERFGNLRLDCAEKREYGGADVKKKMVSDDAYSMYSTVPQHHTEVILFLFFTMARQPLGGPRPPHFSRLHDHTF